MEAIIGVVGTVLGTILGWLLNSLSQKGRLYFYIKQWEDKFEEHEDGGLTKCTSIESAECYTFSLNLDIYNSSAETKIMRDILVVFANGKQILRAITPKDYATQRYAAHSYHYDDVGPINIPPKTVINLVLYYYEWDNNKSLKKFFNTNKIFLQYTDEKNQTKKVLISSKNYEYYFLSQ